MRLIRVVKPARSVFLPIEQGGLGITAGDDSHTLSPHGWATVVENGLGTDDEIMVSQVAGLLERGEIELVRESYRLHCTIRVYAYTGTRKKPRMSRSTWYRKRGKGGKFAPREDYWSNEG